MQKHREAKHRPCRKLPWHRSGQNHVSTFLPVFVAEAGSNCFHFVSGLSRTFSNSKLSICRTSVSKYHVFIDFFNIFLRHSFIFRDKHADNIFRSSLVNSWCPQEHIPNTFHPIYHNSTGFPPVWGVCGGPMGNARPNPCGWFQAAKLYMHPHVLQASLAHASGMPCGHRLEQRLFILW